MCARGSSCHQRRAIVLGPCMDRNESKHGIEDDLVIKHGRIAGLSSFSYTHRDHFLSRNP
ncbi:protein of unknown function [Pararobbsia alpina]